MILLSLRQARTIRKEVESKLPEDGLCQQQSVDSNVNMALVRQNAELVLNDLAKHLVALKASEGRLNDDARRSYLQVSLVASHSCNAMPCFSQHFLHFRICTTNMQLQMTPTLFR